MEVGDNFTALDGPYKDRKFNIKQVDIDDNRIDAAEYKVNKKGELMPQKGRPRKFTYAQVSKWFGNSPATVPSHNSPVSSSISRDTSSTVAGSDDILETLEMQEWNALRASTPDELKSFISAMEDKSTTDDW